MRSRLVNAATLIAAMANLPAQKGLPFGEAAKDLSEAEANRYSSRLYRRQWSSDRGMSPDQLVVWSRQRRRARQTHPGKRGKRARA